MIAELDGVTKRYGTVTALNDVRLTLRSGEVLALLGPNGAGKTTAVRLMLGLTKPTHGTVRLCGQDPRARGARERVGVMLQVAKVPETLKVSEHVHLFSSYYPAPLPLERTMELAGLSGLANRKFGDLSGGQRQRTLFALAICGDPDVLFLDEPTVGLDVEARRGFWTVIRRLVAEGRSILLTTHYLEEADALADRIVLLNHGAVVADGTPREIKQQAAGRQIRCVTRLTRDELSALPGVKAVSYDKGVSVLVASDAERVARTLLSLDETLSGLEIAALTLEDAFLALTRARSIQKGDVS